LSQDDGCEDEVNLLYKTVEGTKWNVESVAAVDKKETSQNENNRSLALVGGLQNVIEELREIIQFTLKGSPLVQGMYCFGSRPFTQQSKELSLLNFTIWEIYCTIICGFSVKCWIVLHRVHYLIDTQLNAGFSANTLKLSSLSMIRL